MSRSPIGRGCKTISHNRLLDFRSLLGISLEWCQRNQTLVTGVGDGDNSLSIRQLCWSTNAKKPYNP